MNIYIKINYAEAWQNNKFTHEIGLIYTNLENEMTPLGYAILGDSAIVTGNKNEKLAHVRKTKDYRGSN